VSFEVPWALWGLLGLPLLWALALRRRRPQHLVWPSLLLWQDITEASEATRRRWDRLLLLECLALVVLSIAAAGPVVRVGSTGRRVVVLVDKGPWMDARRRDGETAESATRREVERIKAALGSQDEVVELPLQSDPLRAVLASRDSGLLVIATARPVAVGRRALVVGRAAEGINLGVDAVRVDGDKLWFAIATDGAPRRVRVRVGDAVREVQTGRGVTGPLAGTIEILDADNYDGDDRIDLRPCALAARDLTGSSYVRAALAAAARPREAASPDLVITGAGGEKIPGDVRGAECVIEGSLFDGLLLDGCRWRGVRARRGPGCLSYKGRALAAWLDPRTFWLGAPVDRDWDDQSTLALLIRRVARERLRALLGPGEVLVGDAVARPAPGLVDTRGVDRPWNGKLPSVAPGPGVSRQSKLRIWLALLAAVVLGFYLRAVIVQAR